MNILGIDIQPSAIGMTYVDAEKQKILASILKVFNEPVITTSKGDKKLKNEKRRIKRGTRRNLTRSKGRRKAVLKILVEHGYLPEDVLKCPEKVFTDIGDVYELREKALSELLSDYELGTVLYHFAHRRGFLSNRKENKDSKSKIVVKGISDLEIEMQEQNHITLGEHLNNQSKKRSRYTSRRMYRDELDIIFKRQIEFDRDSISDELVKDLKREIFFQKPLKIQKFLVGMCSLEPKKKRFEKARIQSQRYSIWQTINNISLQNPETRQFYSPTLEEKQLVAEKLETQKTLSWGKFRKLLNIDKNTNINLETAKCESLDGNITAFELKKALGDTYDSLSEEQLFQLMEDLLTIHMDEPLMKRLTTHWGFDKETAKKLCDASFDSGYMNYSKKAIEKLLIPMQRGIHQATALKNVYDMQSEDETPLEISDNGKFADVPNLRNPSVQKALYELKHIMEKFVKKYGHPDEIIVEMGTDLKKSKKLKDKIAIEQAVRKKANKKVKKTIQTKFNIPEPSKKDITKFNLWEECNKTCPYTGKPIPESLLFSEHVHTEHIIPESISYDSSYTNLTLCMADENIHAKGNKTPWEAYGNTPQYGEILKRVDKFINQKNKKKKLLFESKDNSTDFISRELNDTRWIARETKTYLKRLGFKVRMGNGNATSLLRNAWKLNDILGTKHKNREDHRHHVIDSAAVSMTSHAVLKEINKISTNENTPLRSVKIPLPWDSFKDDLKQAIDNTTVHFGKEHRLSGALHEETNYGFNKNAGRHTIRVSIEYFAKSLKDIDKKKSKINNIVDGGIRELIITALKAKHSFNKPILHKDGKTPIKKVKIFKTLNNVLTVDKNNTEYNFTFGNNHHVEIFKVNEKDKYKGRVVTTFEATQRIQQGIQSAIDRKYDGHEYIMTLFKNDMLEITDKTGQLDIYRVQKFSKGSVILRHHTSTTSKDKDIVGRIACTPNTLMTKYQPRKYHGECV